MLLIPQARLALLFPWKTASQTLQARLEGLGVRPYPKLPSFNPHLRKVVHQHLTLLDWTCLPESRQGLDLAVFVRNPYDRVVSGFRQMLRDIQNLPRIQYPEPWVRELVMEQVASVYASISRAGFDVDRWFQQLSPHEILDTGHSICFCLHPVTYWTHRGDQPVADFIGRVETFETDFDRLAERYGITGMPHRDANRSDPRLARPDRYNYLYAYNLRPRTIAKINELFREDFELLGYPKIVPPPAAAGVTLTPSGATGAR